MIEKINKLNDENNNLDNEEMDCTVDRDRNEVEDEQAKE